MDQPTEQVSLSTRSRKEGRLIYRTPSGVVSSPRIGRHVRLFQVHISEWKLELAPAPTSYSPPTKTFGRKLLHFPAVYGTCKSHKAFAQIYSSCTVYERWIRRKMYSCILCTFRFGTLSVVQHRKPTNCQPGSALVKASFSLANFLLQLILLHLVSTVHTPCSRLRLQSGWWIETHKHTCEVHPRGWQELERV